MIFCQVIPRSAVIELSWKLNQCKHLKAWMFSFRCTPERSHWTLLLCPADNNAAAGRSGWSNPNFGRHCGHCTALIPAQSSSNEGLHQQMSSITHFFCCSRSQLIFTFMVFFKTHSLTDIDECRNTSSCLNGATCQNTIGNFKCTCAKGFTGDNCGKVENICMKTPFFLRPEEKRVTLAAHAKGA